MWFHHQLLLPALLVTTGVILVLLHAGKLTFIRYSLHSLRDVIEQSFLVSLYYNLLIFNLEITGCCTNLCLQKFQLLSVDFLGCQGFQNWFLGFSQCRGVRYRHRSLLLLRHHRRRHKVILRGLILLLLLRRFWRT